MEMKCLRHSNSSGGCLSIYSKSKILHPEIALLRLPMPEIFQTPWLPCPGALVMVCDADYTNWQKFCCWSANTRGTVRAAWTTSSAPGPGQVRVSTPLKAVRCVRSIPGSQPFAIRQSGVSHRCSVTPLWVGVQSFLLERAACSAPGFGTAKERGVPAGE